MLWHMLIEKNCSLHVFFCWIWFSFQGSFFNNPSSCQKFKKYFIFHKWQPNDDLIAIYLKVNFQQIWIPNLKAFRHLCPIQSAAFVQLHTWHKVAQVIQCWDVFLFELDHQNVDSYLKITRFAKRMVSFCFLMAINFEAPNFDANPGFHFIWHAISIFLHTPRLFGQSVYFRNNRNFEIRKTSSRAFTHDIYIHSLWPCSIFAWKTITFLYSFKFHVVSD